jgi:hypothetical protein
MIMWAIQIFLALTFGAVGTMKLVRSKAKLAANPHLDWVHSVPEAQIKFLGVAEVLGPRRWATALAALTIVVAAFRRSS